MFKVLLKLKPRDRFFKPFSLKQQNWCDFWGYVTVVLKTQFMDSTQVSVSVIIITLISTMIFANITKNFLTGSNDVCLIVFLTATFMEDASGHQEKDGKRDRNISPLYRSTKYIFATTSTAGEWPFNKYFHWLCCPCDSYLAPNCKLNSRALWTI